MYNLENKTERERFMQGSKREIAVYGTNRKLQYDPEMRIGVGVSRIGTSKAISVGAYAFALQSMSNHVRSRG